MLIAVSSSHLSALVWSQVTVARKRPLLVTHALFAHQDLVTVTITHSASSSQSHHSLVHHEVPNSACDLIWLSLCERHFFVLLFRFNITVLSLVISAHTTGSGMPQRYPRPFPHCESPI